MAEKAKGLSSIPKLNGSNYLIWKYIIKNLLEGQDLMHVIERPRPKIPGETVTPEDKAAYETWRKNSEALRIITCTMGEHEVSLILNLNVARGIWKDLEQRYEGRLDTERKMSRSKLSKLKMERDENWKEYIRRARELNEEAKMVNLGMEETELITLITDDCPLNIMISPENSKA
ncbi:uncharacterized protein [Centruroides vittatus]|uniref:uncharacterized protein n=1 Tax=Centruroides vittatus TaxID=120091 RepID=UPI00350F6C3B